MSELIFEDEPAPVQPPVEKKKPGPKPKPKVEVAADSPPKLEPVEKKKPGPKPKPKLDPEPEVVEEVATSSYNFVPPPRNLTGRVVVIDVLSLIDIEKFIETQGGAPKDSDPGRWLLDKLADRKQIFRVPKTAVFMDIMALAPRVRAGGAELALLAALPYPRHEWQESINRWLMGNAAILRLFEDYSVYLGSDEEFIAPFCLDDIHVVTPSPTHRVPGLFKNPNLIIASELEEPRQYLREFMPRVIDTEATTGEVAEVVVA